MSLKAHPLRNTTIIFLFAAPLVIFFYAAYIFNYHHADNLILYGLLIVADLIGMFSVLGLWLTILLDVLVPEHHNRNSVTFTQQFLDTKPSVDIFITVAGEDLEIIKSTAAAALNIAYPHSTYILDDGKSDDVYRLSQQWRIGYIRRADRTFAKSGNINHGLQYTKGEFFVILDADQTPRPHLISTLLPYMADPQVAMAQAPQHFINLDKFVSCGTAYAQEIFYKYICPARNLSNSVFCVGTNVMFRRAAIDQVGGIARLAHSEDLWTSMHLHENGWKTVYVNQILTDGLAPDNIASYLRQQLRWAKGGLGMFFHKNPLTVSGLTLDQKLQYLFSNAYFFVFIPLLIYSIFPILYLLFDLKPLHTQGWSWIIHYLPYVSIYYLLTWLLLGKFHIASISVSLASFYPYLQALWSIWFGTSQEWVATAARHRRSPAKMQIIWPYVLLIMLTVFSLLVGWLYPLNFWATLFYTILGAWNIYLLFIFITADNRVALTNK